MKRSLLMMMLLVATSLFAGQEDSVITGVGEGGALIGGTMGIAAIHGIFWAPIILFLLGAGMVIGFYYKMFKQKDDGVWKTLLAFAGSGVVGVLLYGGSMMLVDGLFDSRGCGTDIVTAYMKDSVKMGLNGGNYTFGTNIKAVQCLQ